MDEPKLIIDSKKEFGLDDDLITIGRATDNSIAFSGDSKISRYHAEIERRGDDFWLIDLGSFNGTKINGERLKDEKPLNNGDILIFGGTSQIEVALTDRAKEDEEKSGSHSEGAATLEHDTTSGEIAPPKKSSSKIPIMLVVAALAVGLAVVFVAAAGLFYLTRKEAACEATAKILKPEKGDTIKDTTEIEVEITGDECIAQAVYMIDEREIAKSKESPFSASIDPTNHPEFSDGLNRPLKVILFDKKGIEISQSNEVALFMETIEVEPPTTDPTPTTTQTSGNPPPTGNQTKPSQTSIKDTIAMTGNVVKQFSGNFAYKTANPQFLREIRKATAAYLSEGYFERARKYRDVINIAFIRERNLDPPLGYILAMSRSKFLPKNDAQGTGLWKMSADFVRASAYDGLCGEETISSASQNCAAKASSHYLKDLLLNVFEGDVVYGVAAFGMTPQEADQWKASLPQNREDFWNVIKSPQQRQEVVNFFAAAIVAENPQSFGLEKDRPLSGLYSVFMK